jgi:hypothetical protein
MKSGISCAGWNQEERMLEFYESAVPVQMKRSSKITKETKDIYKIIKIKGDRERTILLLVVLPTGLTLWDLFERR